MNGASTSKKAVEVAVASAGGEANPNTRVLHDLGERVKELTALYRAAAVLQREDRPVRVWLEELAALLPPAWQYPEVTAARVCVGDLAAETLGFVRTEWVQRAEFVTADGEAGQIEVAYLEPRPDEKGGEGPFLAEERKLIEGLAEMLRSAVSRRRAQEALLMSERQARRLLHELGERVKELTALYRAANLLEHEERPLQEWLDGIALLLPPAWQYPEVTAGRIRVGDLEARTPAYRATRWSQRRDFVTADGVAGVIEVVYLEERPAETEGPFLAEERKLIDGLAEMVRSALSRRAARERLRESMARIQDLAGRLITAQESERSRIARELHDDLNQRLAALSLGLSALKRQAPAHAEQVHSIQKGALDLAARIRGLSHRLHPSVLRHTGLASALRALCDEMGRGEGSPRVVFSTEAALPELQEDLALCLFRVAQESLRNALMHAEAKAVSVAVSAVDGAVLLLVSDDGKGFDAGARNGGGMGLLSMDERVRLANGTIEFDTRPGRGTEVRVRVPLKETGDATTTGDSGR